MSTATTSSDILKHTTSFISELLAQSELRHRLVSTFNLKSGNQKALKPLNLAAETIENAISTSNPSIGSSSLRLAKKILLSYPESPFSSFLLSLIYGFSNQPLDAALSLLDIFYSDPSLARSEIAPVIFEELFLVHLLPVLQEFKDQRSRIFSSLLPNLSYDCDEHSLLDESVVLPSTKLLSKMSGGQASELKELECSYEEVLYENCRAFAKYFKEILRNKGGDQWGNPPLLSIPNIRGGDKEEYSDHDSIKSDQIEMKNGRYNPIWAEEDKSVEFDNSSGTRMSNFLSFYPERVSMDVLVKNSKSSERLRTNPNSKASSSPESYVEDNSSNNSSFSESDVEKEETNRKMALFESSKNQLPKRNKLIPAESSGSPDLFMTDSDNSSGGGRQMPPKDFICPITSNIFDDPVTLETGQTYERRAIQEWVERGKSTCPITRQKLHGTHLPKTNYVLKRLITSWLEQNPISVTIRSEPLCLEIETTSKSIMPSTSPNSVISQAAIDGTVGELRHAITNLCMSEILKESEIAVLRIEKFWKAASMEVDIQTMLSKPPVINSFVEILFNSVDPQVIKATVFLLSDLGSRDKVVIQTLTQLESDVECIMELFKKGLLEAVVLLYLLRSSILSLIEMDIMEPLLLVIKEEEEEEDMLMMCLNPRRASILLLGYILGNCEENIASSIARSVVSAKVIENIIGSLKAELEEERLAAVGILLRCMQEDGKCRNTIADIAELAPVLESFVNASDVERFQIVQFLSELVKLKRRTFNAQILHVIKDEGTFSTMHTLLAYLQTAVQDQCPAVAGLLLQLDLLMEPRKMSIYREEAIDTLISCLRNTESPASQIAAADTILSLQGRFSASGKPLIRACLLKRAGLENSYRTLMRMDQLSNTSEEVDQTLEEEKAADDWERKMAFVLVSHEFGLLFEALAEGLKSRYAELCSACFMSATWLVHMLSTLPDTGLCGAARVCLLKRLISIFKSAKDKEDRTLSMLALSTFIRDPDGLHDITLYMKDILKGLRELKRFSPLAFELLKILSEGHDSSVQDLWNHKELVQVDCSENGEVLSIVSLKDKIISGHSDGTIKVWTGRGSILHLVQEIREHTKAVTSLAILQSGDRVYSGSIDRTTRVWSMNNNGMQCIQVHEMKDQVNNLAVANSISCFIPHGAGIKVHSWNGSSKHLNANKHVRSLALVHGKLYCGCQDNSIQEIDLATGTLSTIQSGSRKLIGKANPIHALQVHNGLIYSASSFLDGAAVKIWSAANYSLVGSVQSTVEVRAMAVSSDLIYLGCKAGTVEIWCRENHNRGEVVHNKVETLHTGTNGKVLCMALNGDEEVLVVGTSDGRIQAWGLS